MASILVLTISMIISGIPIKIGYIPKSTVTIIDSSSKAHPSTDKAVKFLSKIERSGGSPIVATVQVTLLIPNKKTLFLHTEKNKNSLYRRIKRN